MFSGRETAADTAAEVGRDAAEDIKRGRLLAWRLVGGGAARSVAAGSGLVLVHLDLLVVDRAAAARRLAAKKAKTNHREGRDGRAFGTREGSLRDDSVGGATGSSWT